MFDCEAVVAQLGRSTDPRVDGRFIRCWPATDSSGPVLLIGVVHDHPASVARVAWVLEAFPVETLALELPPLALALFEAYADDSRRPPPLGGEMSAALQAATATTTVGIDAPTWLYLRQLIGTVRYRSVSWATLRRLGRDSWSAAAHALACRLANVLAAWTPFRLRLYEHITYDTTALDTPAAQAADETNHLSQREALFRAISTHPAVDVIDTAREESMGLLIHRHRRNGAVAAVVGMEHLDPLCEILGRLERTGSVANHSE